MKSGLNGSDVKSGSRKQSDVKSGSLRDNGEHPRGGGERARSEEGDLKEKEYEAVLLADRCQLDQTSLFLAACLRRCLPRPLHTSS